jgi:hypothetical protein
MHPFWRMLSASILVFGIVAPLTALSDPVPDAVEANRDALKRLRDDPKAHAALLRDARAFLQLPEERREQLVKLENDLQRVEPAKREKLLRVLRRYAAWQDRLGDQERRSIQDAATAKDRLEVVRELREREWVKRLPKADREKLNGLQGAQRSQMIRRLRLERQAHKEEWQLAFRFWDELLKKTPLPTRLSDLPQDVQTYFNEYLKPLLHETELDSLNKLEGIWPDYPRKLVELADRHPLALPGPTGPTKLEELPLGVRERFHKARPKVKPQTIDNKWLRRNEGKWPGYGTAVSDAARNPFAMSLPYEMWPSRFQDLSIPVRQFVEKQLRPVLDKEELKRLQAAENSWPTYPQTIHDLAQKHQMQVPWQSLPGPADLWNKYRYQLPALRSQLWLTPRQAAPVPLAGP